MRWPPARTVLLVCEERRCLGLVAAELKAMGCRVLCARDLEQAADLVRAGLTTRFVLVSLGMEVVSPADLRRSMAERLPEWSIESDEVEARSGDDGPDQRAN